MHQLLQSLRKLTVQFIYILFAFGQVKFEAILELIISIVDLHSSKGRNSATGGLQCRDLVIQRTLQHHRHGTACIHMHRQENQMLP